VHGLQLKQAVGKMQHRKAENAFVLPSKRINSEKTKNDGSVGCSEKCRHCTAVPFNTFFHSLFRENTDRMPLLTQK